MCGGMSADAVSVGGSIAADVVRRLLADRTATAWCRVDATDHSIFDQYAAQAPQDLYSYERSWAYYRQETRHLGLRRELDDNLWIAVIRYDDSPFVFVFPPIGPNGYRAATVRLIAAELRALTGRRVIFRKVTDRGLVEIARLGEAVCIDPREFTDSRDVPEDVNPQIVIDVATSLAQVGSDFMRIRNHIRRFVVEREPAVQGLSGANVGDVKRLVQRWNEEGRDHFDSRRASTSAVAVANEGAYTIFSDSFHNAIDDQTYFAHLVYVGGDVAGFVFAGRTSDQSAALYASLALTCYRGSSEFLIQTLLGSLARAGIRYLNMGGSETINLFRYKSKFAFAALRPAFDLELEV
jgi:Phosphatidylglycerol lysyltransferase, C-terminal